MIGLTVSRSRPGLYFAFIPNDRVPQARFSMLRASRVKGSPPRSRACGDLLAVAVINPRKRSDPAVTAILCRVLLIERNTTCPTRRSRRSLTASPSLRHSVKPSWWMSTRVSALPGGTALSGIVEPAASAGRSPRSPATSAWRTEFIRKLAGSDDRRQGRFPCPHRLRQHRVVSTAAATLALPPTRGWLLPQRG